MNLMRYGTLLDIEKECGKNKRKSKLLSHSIPEIQQEISDLQDLKLPYEIHEHLDNQISLQASMIKDG